MPTETAAEESRAGQRTSLGGCCRRERRPRGLQGSSPSAAKQLEAVVRAGNMRPDPVDKGLESAICCCLHLNAIAALADDHSSMPFVAVEDFQLVPEFDLHCSTGVCACSYNIALAGLNSIGSTAQRSHV